MVYPIKNWPKLKRGFLFRQKYPASFGSLAGHHHLGLDIIAPSGTPILAWQDLDVVRSTVGIEGGNTIFVKCPNNKRLFRLMHLLNPVKVGHYKQGMGLAKVGSSGTASTGSHLHIDLSKNGILELNNFSNFENPEAYFKRFVI